MKAVLVSTQDEEDKQVPVENAGESQVEADNSCDNATEVSIYLFFSL